MTARSLRAGVCLAAIAALVLWYLLASAGQSTLDFIARGIAFAVAAWDGPATHWLPALEAVLPALAAVVDGLLWTLWLLGSVGLLLTAGYAIWLLRQGAWHGPQRTDVRRPRARGLLTMFP